jgi:alkylhydroperoxidase family enzyme
MELVIHTVGTAPGAAADVLADIEADFGFIPNLAAATATSPRLVAGFDGLRRAAAGTEIDPVHREIAGLAVGVAANNEYGVAFHSLRLDRLGCADIDDMRAGAAPGDPAQAAVYEFARELTLRRGDVEDKRLDALRRAGYDTAGILDILTECAFATLVGLIDNLAGHVQLDPPLRPRAWSAP